MVKETYSKAYTELLEILKCLPIDEFNKIPKEKIEYFRKNKDNTYRFIINPEKPLEEQNISIEANSIIVTIFRDYFATESQKEKMEIILKQNEDKYQDELRHQYDPDNLFKNRNTEDNYTNKTEINNLPIEVKEKKLLYKIY